MRFLHACVIGLATLLSCSGSPAGEERSSLHLMVTMRDHQWTEGETIGVQVGEGACEETALVCSGGVSAHCLLPVRGKKPVTVFGRYPSDAPASWADGRIHFTLPTLQDGTLSPLSAGVTTGTPGAYNPAAMELKPLYRVLPVNLGRIPIQVKSFTLRPGGGALLAGACTMDPSSGEISPSESTIRVVLPTPVDCSEGSVVIPVMAAAVDFPEGLSAEVETVAGETIVIPDIDAFVKRISTPYTLGTSIAINSSQTASQMQRIKDAGIEWVEVTCNSFQRNIPEAEWETRAENIRKLIENLGLKIWSCHLPYSGTLDISVLDDAKRAENVAIQKRMIRLCGEKYHPQRLVLHPSSEPIAEGDRAKRLENARASIGELLPVAREIGAVLCIENLPRTCLGRVTSEMQYLIEPYPEVMVCFDVNHLLIETHAKYFADLGDRIGNVHISDYDRVDERHALPGDGVIDWPALHYMLRLSGYDGIFMHEVKAAAGTPAQVVERYNNVIFVDYE